MPWHVAVVHGHAHQATFYLRRRGIRCCAPTDHDYTPRPRMPKDGYRIVYRIPGYVFVELLTPMQRAVAMDCPQIYGMLGTMTSEGYRLGEIPKNYMAELMDAKPRDLNRPKSRRFNKGQKVEHVINDITKVIGEFSHMLDKKGRAVITVNGKFNVEVSIERLQAAE